MFREEGSPPPQTSPQWEGDTLPVPHPSRRLDPRAFGARPHS
jgi:hypothetical protein